jgi:hypothetical protein
MSGTFFCTLGKIYDMSGKVLYIRKNYDMCGKFFGWDCEPVCGHFSSLYDLKRVSFKS